ncbi:MAG: aldo/keto reductase, partial [Bifidobacteriales bacterium]|nr:aldo/keto reductase [Bifidobacteriales bacterium]
MAAVPDIELADGRRIPQIGLGVLRIADDQTGQVVESALSLGYRHIDTAAGYQNEAGVGRGLKAAGYDTGSRRESIWLTT